MAALEYLTQNSLTAYPFKTRRDVGQPYDNPIQTGWFLDILFVSYSAGLRSVYISHIDKDSASLSITFSDVDTQTPLSPFTISGPDFVAHLNNHGRSFASFSTDDFAVKLVLGAALFDTDTFSQSYVPEDSTLLASAVVLQAPIVHSLGFESYDGTVGIDGAISYDIVDKKTYSYPDVPRVQPRYNSEFKLEAGNNSGSWAAARGLGYGIYDGCPAAGEELLSINSVKPNTTGALFLTSSSCYSLNGLDEELVATLDASGDLSSYHLFAAHNTENTTILDVVQPGATLVLQNHCSPKCPPENLTAFAYYLNRVTDGAAELNQIAYKATQTRGLATNTLEVLTVAPGDFCAANSPFALCDGVTCDAQFIKYFHEFRTLQIFYSSVDIQSYIILEVIDDHTVRLDRVPKNSTLPKLPFRVIDTGVVSNLNCASVLYNQDAQAYLKPYFKVKYTTSEAYNSAGQYVTYLSVAVAVFNPSHDRVDLRLELSHAVLTQQDNFKIRKEGDIHSSNDPVVSLLCREYAFIEAIYFIPCGVTGGNLHITVLDVTDTNTAPVPVGSQYNILNISGADCPGTSASGANKLYRALTQDVATFSESFDIDSSITNVTVFGDQPPWLVITPDYTSHTINLTSNGTTPSAKSTRYVMYYRGEGSSPVAVVAKLVIDYVAPPVVTTPLGTVYDVLTPLTLSKTINYTTDNPALQVLATNMIRLSNDFPGDSTAFTYSLTPTGTTTELPTGLSFDSTKGLLTGQIDSSVAGGTVYEYVASATNPAGDATNPQTVVLETATAIVPTLHFTTEPPSDTFTVTNLDVFTANSPLFTLLVTGAPIFSFDLSGELPAGLTFNQATGLITGHVTELTAGSKSVAITARNAHGTSSALSFTITYSLFHSPTITSPANGDVIHSGVTISTDITNPLFTITGTQALGGTDNFDSSLTDTSRNSYSAVGLPPGFSVDQYTGKVYGQLSASELPTDPAITTYTKTYAVKLIATNPVGSYHVSIQLSLSSVAVPSVLNAPTGTQRQVTRDKSYTDASPLFTIQASNSPTSFSASGLPVGLTCTAAGKIIGTVLSSQSGTNPPPSAGAYTVSLSATNSVGTSSTATIQLVVPISFISPVSGDTLYATLGSFSTVVSLVVTSTLDGSPVTFSATGLPAGLSVQGSNIQGTGLNLETSGAVITATSTLYGTVKLPVTVSVVPNTYSISGHALDSFGAPLSGVAITDGHKQVITDSSGFFLLNNVLAGAYNISASKAGTAFLPRYQSVQVVDASVGGVNFESDGPYRLISGSVTIDGTIPLVNATVSAGAHVTQTDSFGRYELFVPFKLTDPVTPTIPNKIFVPPSMLIQDGTADISGINFITSSASISKGAPVINSLTPGDRQLIVNFTVPSDDDNIKYLYSTDGGLEYLSQLGPIINSILSRDTALLVNFSVLADDPATRYDYSTDSGKTYNLTS